MVVPFASFTAWDVWIRPIGRGYTLPKGSGGGVVEANKLNPLTVRELIDLLATLIFTM